MLIFIAFFQSFVYYLGLRFQYLNSQTKQYYSDSVFRFSQYRIVFDIRYSVISENQIIFGICIRAKNVFITLWHTAHCTLHTAHCTLHTAHCTLHTTHRTLPHHCGWRRLTAAIRGRLPVLSMRCAVLYLTVLFYTIMCCVETQCTVLCCTVLCCTLLSFVYNLLYCSILFA